MKWEQARAVFADRARDNFENEVPTAMGVEEEIAHLDANFEAPSREEYQQTIEALGEAEHVELKYEEDSPWDDVPVAALIDDGFFDEEMNDEEGFFPEEYEGIRPEISYDLSNELEKATGVTLSLVAAHQQRDILDRAKMDSIPEDTRLFRIGHVPGLAVEEAGDFYDRERFEDRSNDFSQEDISDFMTQKRRYIDHLKSHGEDLMVIGGTDSIQVTMRPAIEGTPDTMMRDFLGAGDGPSMLTASPLMYAPFMSSPVVGEDGGLESHMGRIWEYRRGFDGSDYADDQKFGLVEDLMYVEGVEDAMDVFADKRFQFSAEVEASDLEVVGSDETLYEAVADDHSHIDEDTEFNVRVGHEEYGVIDFTHFVEEREFEGIVSLPNPDTEEEMDEVRVRADYSSLEEDEFVETAWEHFVAHCTGVWPSYNPRFEAGAFESRDYGDSPRIKEAVDTQAALFHQWREVQEYAEETLDVHDQYASIIRDGIAEEGMDFVLPSGHTVEEAWYGADQEDGLLDILTRGVAELAYADDDATTDRARAYAEEYREAMKQYLEKGTFSDVFVEMYREEGLEEAMSMTEVGRGDR